MLTIGLPFYNNEKTLANAIKSVLAQTYQYWELILVNDGSTDNSYKIAKDFSKSDNRIKLLSDGVNKGLIYRLNQIIDVADGKYIARMDSDDMMMPTKLESQMEVLLKNKLIDVIDTAAYTIDDNDNPTGMRGMTDLSTWNRKKTFKNVLLFHPTVIAKTSWYRQNKYNQQFVRSEDFELWCRTFEYTVFERIYQPLFLYREGKVNIRNYTASNRTHRKMLRMYYKGVLSKKEVWYEIVKSHLKSNLYRIFAILNLQDRLTANRNNKLTAAQIEEVKTVLKKIKDWE